MVWFPPAERGTFGAILEKRAWLPRIKQLQFDPAERDWLQRQLANRPNGTTSQRAEQGVLFAAAELPSRSVREYHAQLHREYKAWQEAREAARKAPA